MATKHIRKDRTWFINRWMSDFNKVHDFRLSAIINGYYLEYLLNELLIQYFPIDHKAKVNDLTFFQKLELLKNKEAFKNSDIIYNNVKLLNEIRNYYAHNIGEDIDDLPNKVKEKIENLTYDISSAGIVGTDYKAKFSSTSAGAIAYLLSVCNVLI